MPPIKKLPMFSDCVEDTIDMPEVTEECDACDQFLYELERMQSELDSLRAFIISRTRPMQGASASSAGEEGLVPQPLAGEQDLFLKGDGTWAVVPGMTPINPATQVPFMDGTGAVGVSAKYAREDHRHPSDTSKQDVLVSGTNIKTVNGNSLLGSGDIPMSGGGTPSSTMPVMDGAGTAGAATEYARGDHQHPSDTSKADKATTLAGYGITDAYTKTETDNALANKVDKVSGKGLSTNDFTTTLKDKLDGIAAGAEVNVNADWNANSGDAQILHKPSIPSPSSTTPVMDGTAATGSETAYARGDHVHPSDTSKLDLTGGEMSGDIDMMDNQILFRGGTYGAVFGQANGARVYPLATPTQDYDAATKKYVDDHHDSTKANLASPTFTGTPKAPTAAAGTNTTQIATTAFVNTALTNLLGSSFEAQHHYYGSSTGSHTFSLGGNVNFLILGGRVGNVSGMYVALGSIGASAGGWKTIATDNANLPTVAVDYSAKTVTVTSTVGYYKVSVITLG